MKKILLVKITSMGDLIQMLPALTDATRAIPGLQFDWLAEESFQEVPRLHSAINRIVPLAYRRWKKNVRQALRQGEISAFLKQLRQQRYDMVIDAQSNIKSAVVSLFAKGKRYGLDAASVREYGAQWGYHHQIHVDRAQNHVERMRQLLATLLGYKMPDTPADYGIDRTRLPTLPFELPSRFVFITPIASVPNKLWPETYWATVIQSVVTQGYDVLMPWWSPEEHARVLRLQNNHPQVHLLPKISLTEKASVLARADAAISLDTGLAHMAAALNIPNVCLYGPSDPRHCGTIGYQQIHLSATLPACAPCEHKHCAYQGLTDHQPACMASIHPERVLEAFQSLVVRS